MTRVLHVVVAGEVGGAERMLVDLASRPEESRAVHSVALVTPSERLRELLRSAGLRVRDRGPAREGALSFLVRALGPVDVAWIARAAQEERAEIVHLHTFGSQVVGTRAAGRVGARVVRTEHSTRAFVDPSCLPFTRWSLPRADVAVAISAHVARVAQDRVPAATGRLRVVFNGVDVARFAPLEAPAAGPITFAVVGRLEPRKGVDRAIDALAQVPEARLSIVGDGVERADLEARARGRGLGERVRFLGFTRDVRDAVANADAVLCSSREEGLGIALLEAMAMERPVIGLATGGVPEYVTDGVTGLLAPPEAGVAGLVRVMREATRDRGALRALGAAAGAHVRAHLSIEAMCRGYADAYDAALAGRSRA